MEVMNSAGGGRPQDSLAAIEARLERIERLLTPISEIADAVPGGAATIVDILDDIARRDGRMDERIRAIHRLTVSATDPVTLNMLSDMLEHAKELPLMLATLADAFDDIARQDGRMEQRVRALAELTKAVTEPEMLATIKEMLEHARNLPLMVATAVDTLDAVAAELAQNGIHIESLLDSAKGALRGASRLATSPELRALLESGMLAPETLSILGRIAGAVGEARAHSQPVGLLGALRAAKDSGVQRALGFLTSVASEFGRTLNEDHKPKRLEGGHV